VGLAPRPKAVARPPAAEFPHGPRTEVGDGMRGCLIESVRAPGAQSVFVDLDTGRAGPLPERLRPAPRPPARLGEIPKWAAEEGYDLMGTEYPPPGGGGPHYVIRGLGLTAWQIDAGRRETLETEVKAAGPLDMGTKARELLAPFDAAAGRYRAAETGLFLF